MKKIVFFYSKRPPSPAKNSSFAWKNDKKVPKKLPKRAPSPTKTWSFAWKIENRPTYGYFEKKKIATPNFTKFLNPYENFSALFYLYSNLI